MKLEEKELEQILSPLWDYVPDQIIGMIDEQLEDHIRQEKTAAVNAALEEASEKARVKKIDYLEWKKSENESMYVIDKESILSLQIKDTKNR